MVDELAISLQINHLNIRSMEKYIDTMLVSPQHEPMCLNNLNIGAAAVQQGKQIELIIPTINSFFTTV